MHPETSADFRRRILQVAPQDQHVLINVAGDHKLDAIGRMHGLERKGMPPMLDLRSAIINYEEKSAHLARFRKAQYKTPQERALHLAVHETGVLRALDQLHRAQEARQAFVIDFARAFIDNLWPDADRSPTSANWRIGCAIAHALAETRT